MLHSFTSEWHYAECRCAVWTLLNIDEVSNLEFFNENRTPLHLPEYSEPDLLSEHRRLDSVEGNDRWQVCSSLSISSSDVKNDGNDDNDVGDDKGHNDDSDDSSDNDFSDDKGIN